MSTQVQNGKMTNERIRAEIKQDLEAPDTEILGVILFGVDKQGTFAHRRMSDSLMQDSLSDLAYIGRYLAESGKLAIDICMSESLKRMVASKEIDD